MKDAYKTISANSEGLFRDRGSKFIAYAFPLVSEAEVSACLEQLRREHPKARHHCFAWRLGLDMDLYRANDDGEPSGTAGRPILGQIDKLDLTNVLVVVVRYFGGTLLGTSGLIQAYRTAAAEALAAATILERTVRSVYEVCFEYGRMGDVMSAIERMGLEMAGRDFSQQACIRLALDKKEAEKLLVQLVALIEQVPLDMARDIEQMQGVQINYVCEKI